MFRLSHLDIAAALAAGLLTFGLAGGAMAHSDGTCSDAVVESCNDTWPNNYTARIACAKRAVDACIDHSHLLGGGNLTLGGAVEPPGLQAVVPTDQQPQGLSQR